ncbi:hypothetical protein R1T40_18440 [Tritonibacter scottomollicae]|uniref:Holin n=1 Tax=Tritonibacter scottomollicae TaxID=483013 RepID=A0ABZ0HEI8_TRISK|nr:hypothetical protein [Tritonibacter scottomollicae]WOI32892.1 hypothetical protein R1T40_18440 [Tritonibacter scottomollicae]
MIGKEGIFSGLWAWLYSDVGQMALAGAAGGLVRWLTLRESWTDGMVSLVVGCICALYLGPLVAPVLSPLIGKITPADPAGFSSFVVGLGGIGFAGFVIDTLRRFWAAKEADNAES